ncbi:type III-A CRISPR-associated RAMP protein Csm5 [uncultured Dialister sp.]|uniref:type III-A CRISPR-associated RAMP protein Csm5 n=1 Tax=uncultured Dialister sp. TaxID=278064 RepID=UPI002593C2F7|nr:type III-A CRISPR-associated RAMP protein Csm5 [uncultured Dialister sp.]
MSMHYWKVSLVCLSPVFVGSGEKFKKSEYIYDKRAGEVHFLDESGWIRFLGRHGIMEDFSNALLANPLHQNLFGYLSHQDRLCREYGSIGNILHAMKKERAVLRTEPYLGNPEKAPNEIAGFVLDAKGNPYIPGSSLKGAFRTAILAHHILQNRGAYSKDWENIRRAAGNKRDMGKAMDNLEREAAIPLDKNGKRDMVKSYFRGLTVSDASLVNGGLCVVPKTDLGLHTFRTHEVSLFRETLKADSTLEFTLGLDDDASAMGHFGIHNFKDFVDVLREFVKFQYEILKKPFESFATDELHDIKGAKNADLVLGGGAGYISKTLVYALAPNKEDAVYVVRKLMENMFKRGHHGWDTEISPHALKLAEVDGRNYLMGLCYLDGEKPLCSDR